MAKAIQMCKGLSYEKECSQLLGVPEARLATPLSIYSTKNALIITNTY